MSAYAVSGRTTQPTALPVELTTQVFRNVEVPGVEPDPSPYQGAAQTAMLHLVPGASLGSRTRYLPLTRRVLFRLSLGGEERPVGIEPTAPVWKTGVSAEFTTAA